MSARVKVIILVCIPRGLLRSFIYLFSDCAKIFRVEVIFVNSTLYPLLLIYIRKQPINSNAKQKSKCPIFEEKILLIGVHRQ